MPLDSSILLSRLGLFVVLYFILILHIVVSMQKFRILGKFVRGRSSSFNSTQLVLGFQVLVQVPFRERCHSKLLTLRSLDSLDSLDSHGLFRGVAIEDKRKSGARVERRSMYSGL
jgi:hypothetical protein